MAEPPADAVRAGFPASAPPGSGETVEAAGAVLWHGAAHGPGSELRTALIHRPEYGDWTFPKGKLDPGEHALAAAVREVHEETGYAVTLGRPLPPQHYEVAGRPKRVRYWAAEVNGDAPLAFEPGEEVDALDWVTASRARRLLTHERDALVLDALMAGPLRTTPLVLLRHGSAGSREDWLAAGRPDARRPLDGAGTEQASELAALLGCYGVRHVVSSDAGRCVQTVAPYAQRHGLRVGTDPVFSEAAFAPEAALERALGLANDGVPAVVCTHRPVLPRLVSDLCARLGGLPPEPLALARGAFWVLHVTGGPYGELAGVEHHVPGPLPH